MIDKKILLAIIRGLTTYDNQTQFDSGIPMIKGKDYKSLIEFIKNCPENKEDKQ